MNQLILGSGDLGLKSRIILALYDDYFVIIIVLCILNQVRGFTKFVCMYVVVSQLDG